MQPLGECQDPRDPLRAWDSAGLESPPEMLGKAGMFQGKSRGIFLMVGGKTTRRPRCAKNVVACFRAGNAITA